VWALSASTIIQIGWSAAPSNLPLWVILLVNAIISGLGLFGSYLAQPDVIQPGATDAAAAK
jgi:hypothetical protein